MGKITQNYPRFAGWEQERVGTDEYTEADVWDDLRAATLSESPAQSVLVIGLYSDHVPAKGEPVEDTRTEYITDKLEQGTVALERVSFWTLPEITKKVQVPAKRHYSHVMQYAAKQPGAIVRRETIYAYQGSRTGTRQVQRRFHLGNMQNVWALKKIVDGENDNLLKFLAKPEGRRPPIGTVVICEPEENDLDCLPQFRENCPNVDVVIFHQPCEKWGVEVSGDPNNWEDEFPALSDLKPEPKEVIVENMLIKGNIHIVAGPPETFKTMGLVEVSSAILDERPVFDLLKVHHRYPILFLCADMSPTQLNDWAMPFNLQKHGLDFRVMKGTNGIPKVDDRVLQKAVHGRILILDTMLDFARIQKAFESGEWTSFMERLRNLMSVHGCVAVIMSAHSTRAEVKSDSDNISKGEYFKDSVTFHGKTDIGFGCKVLKGTSQVKWERIKSRGFKYRNFSFTVSVYDADGNSNLDRGRFPVCTRPEDMKELQEQRKNQNSGGRKPNPQKQEVTQLVLELKQQDVPWPEIAEKAGVSVATAKRYYNENFDSDQGATK